MTKRSKRIATGALILGATGAGGYALSKRMRVRRIMRISNKMAHDPEIRERMLALRFQKYAKEHNLLKEAPKKVTMPRRTKKPSTLSRLWRRSKRKVRGLAKYIGKKS